MKVLTAQQMGEVDNKTIEHGVPGIRLMRNAGAAVYEFIVQLDILREDSTIVVVAGKGNNGGDGHRIAELSVRGGYRTVVVLAGTFDDVKGDAGKCLHEASEVGAEYVSVTDANDLAAVADAVMSADVLVDALFGTGLTGDVTGIPAELITFMRTSGARIVSVDIPSGVDASTGVVSSTCVMADHTVTFGLKKVGHLVYPGKLHCGDTVCVDIGFLPEVVDEQEAFAMGLTDFEARALLPVREPTSHKGSTGRLAIIAGSVGMTGAAALAAGAALRTGAGLVKVGCPESLNDILEIALTEALTVPLPEVRRKRCLALRAHGMLNELARWADVAAVGPGLGTYRETSELIRRFVSEYTGRLVLDADGINAFAGHPELLAAAPGDIVITPHPGEMARLMDTTVADIQADRFNWVGHTAKKTGACVLLKGAPTLICSPGEKIWINTTGNESMATAGMGDVLTGIIAGLSAQGLPTMQAAVLGAHLHGLAGETASWIRGIYGVVAGDVRDSIPEAFLYLIDHTNERSSL